MNEKYEFHHFHYESTINVYILCSVHYQNEKAWLRVLITSGDKDIVRKELNPYIYFFMCV